MTTQPKLESYLAALDKALKAIATSDRAEIITEIKSHVQEAMERDPSQGLETVLASIGEPEQVASRYLLERGLKPSRPSKRSVVKWLVIGFLGTAGLILLAVVFLVWRFTPLVQVNDDKGEVRLLGGLLQIQDKDHSVSKALKNTDLDFSFEGRATRHYEGSQQFKKDEVNKIEIPFSNGKLSVDVSPQGRFSWNCRVKGEKSSTDYKVADKLARLDLGRTDGARCEVEVPSNVAVNVKARNGKIDISKPANSFDVELGNGMVTIEPDAAREYRYDLKVGNGHVDAFNSSDSKSAVGIRVSLGNGMIRRD